MDLNSHQMQIPKTIGHNEHRHHQGTKFMHAT